MSDQLSRHSNSSAAGPSARIIAWRRFWIETLLCLTLLAIIVTTAFGSPTQPLSGIAIVGLVAWIVRILWQRW